LNGQHLRHDAHHPAGAALELPVVVMDASHRARGSIRFPSADVTAAGVFLHTDLLFEIGEVLAVQFQLPGGRGVHARGRVARVHRRESREPRDRAAGMDVDFVEISPDDRAAIQERLRR
jgi:hypothetical protein